MDRSQPSALPAQRLLESVTRSLRHEIGDLLQTIYSTVAILRERLPPDAELEQSLLGNLRGRGEACKNELDALYDLIFPVEAKIGPVDLAELVNGLVTTISPRHERIAVRAEISVPCLIQADAQLLQRSGWLLLTAACQSARHEVGVQVGRGPDSEEIVWIIRDDRDGAEPELLLWLDTPFATTRHVLPGLGLALARRLADSHGGNVTAGPGPDGGFAVKIVLPISPARP